MSDSDQPMSLRPRSTWRARIIVLSVIAIAYGAIFYGIAHIRTPRLPLTNEPPMIMPVAATEGPQRGGLTDAANSTSQHVVQDQDTPPPKHWKFPVIDLMPSAPGFAAAISDLPPIEAAEPDPPEAQTSPSESPSDSEPPPLKPKLRMVQWLRPVYHADQCTSARSPLLLDIQINGAGQPVDMKIAQSSDSAKLDQIVLTAARSWMYATPVWNAQPMEVSARIELRFNC